jgi:hypothetical protein
MDAAVLDDLEGIGQAKRLTARICAEIHNAFTKALWVQTAKTGDPPPVLVHESRFMPARVYRRQVADIEKDRKKQADEQLRTAMSAMCGF